MTLTCHSRSDPRSERVAHSVARVSLAVSGETNDNGGVYKTPVSLANPLASFDPETMVRCRDYRSHQTSHRRAGSGSDLRRLLRGDAVTTSPRSVHAVVFGRLYSRFVRQGGPWGYPHKAKRFANVRAFPLCVHGRVFLFFV